MGRNLVEAHVWAVLFRLSSDKIIFGPTGDFFIFFNYC